MYGAILGDMIGSPYEFDRGGKTKDFPLFSQGSRFTDDTVMTIAVADALLEVGEEADEAAVCAAIVRSMQRWGRRYPRAGYGGLFRRWLASDEPEPYGSFGNGSAMRVAAAGWLYDTLTRTREVVTHNHAEGIKGAEATASAIFLSREGKPKEEIKEYIVREFSYDLSRTLDEIRPHYSMDATCQGSVPEAIISFLESADLEDAVRNAVSLGGDTDTVACIAGSIAEAFYGVPEALKVECRRRLPQEMLAVPDAFDEARQR